MNETVQSPENIETDFTQQDTSGLLGHPGPLTTLFFTELWERFSYYGMRAILILYMSAPASAGGLGFDIPTAASIYGTYTMSVYLLALPGGFLADRLLGARFAVLLGGLIIAVGHFSMTITSLPFFYTGLTLIAIGTGLLKPNISAMVGNLYSANDPRRDAGFSLFFLGINIGAAIAPLICGYLAQTDEFKAQLLRFGVDPLTSWHWGFGVAGIGMTLGLIQYLLQYHRMPGRRPNNHVDAPASDDSTLTMTDCKRIGVILILFVFTVIFGTASEQAGSSLNLFADRLTRTELFGFQFPSSWFQSAIPVYVIIMAPLFSLLWVRMGDRQPSSPAKFSFSLLFLGLAFLVMVPACMAAVGGKVSPFWLLGVFFLQEIGSVMLNTVGLSTVTKLAPAKLVGVMMGVWFLASAVANKTAGYFAGKFDENNLDLLIQLFGSVGLTVLLAAGLLAILTPTIRRMMGGIR